MALDADPTDNQPLAALPAADRQSWSEQLEWVDMPLSLVDDIMIDKISGRSIYAVMSIGGFLGIGEKHHPLPWATLKYDETKGGYRVNLSKQQLDDAPYYDPKSEFRCSADYGRTVDAYYKVPSLRN